MRKRQRDEGDDSDFERRDIPFASIWDQITSEFGAVFTQDDQAATSLLDVSPPAQSTPTRAVSPTGEITMTSEAIPISTVTVQETSFQTTFVTVRQTMASSPTSAPRPSVRRSSTPRRDTSYASSSSVALPSLQLSKSDTSTRAAVVPTFVTSGAASGTDSSPATANTQESASAPSSTPGATVSHPSQKQAIIGGLSGCIAGLFLIGLLACLWWRRRKPRFDDEETFSGNEKSLRPAMARKWSEFTAHSRTPQAPPPAASRGSTPEPDGQILRVSLDNWARPYAHDQGFRESQGPTTLRVMNPDLSRPTTPLRPSIETAGSFLKRQRNALAAALYGRPISRADSPGRHSNMSSSNIDPALSNDFLASKAMAPSVRSASTGTSVPVIVQQPPEDPFLTPPDERAERDDYTKTPEPAQGPTRPGIAPLQAAGATVSRTLSHLGSSLNPFRTKSNASMSSRSISRHSVSTFSSAGDPFMLDRPSLQSPPGRLVAEMERARSGNIMMYEGT